MSDARASDALTSDALASEVRAALARVYDPCSVGVGSPLNIADLGLVRSCDVDDSGGVRIVIGTTTPVCMMVGSLVAGIESEVSTIPDVTALDIQVDTSIVWTPELMSDSTRTSLDARRRTLVAERNLVPRQWELSEPDGEPG